MLDGGSENVTLLYNLALNFSRRNSSRKYIIQGGWKDVREVSFLNFIQIDKMMTLVNVTIQQTEKPDRTSEDIGKVSNTINKI